LSSMISEEMISMLKERRNIASPLNPVVTKEQPPLLPSLVRRDLPFSPP
jgi:hypothetical protein